MVMNNMEKGYLRAINYKASSNKVINPFERGAREIFLACAGRLSETTELETLESGVTTIMVRPLFRLSKKKSAEIRGPDQMINHLERQPL